MSWDNYGAEWHIDHITPKSWFKVEGADGVDVFELKLCWSLENLQPMWAGQNLEKNNRYISDIKLGKMVVTYEQFRDWVEGRKRAECALAPTN